MAKSAYNSPAKSRYDGAPSKFDGAASKYDERREFWDKLMKERTTAYKDRQLKEAQEAKAEAERSEYEGKRARDAQVGGEIGRYAGQSLIPIPGVGGKIGEAGGQYLGYQWGRESPMGATYGDNYANIMGTAGGVELASGATAKSNMDAINQLKPGQSLARGLKRGLPSTMPSMGSIASPQAIQTMLSSGANFNPVMAGITNYEQMRKFVKDPRGRYNVGKQKIKDNLDNVKDWGNKVKDWF